MMSAKMSRPVLNLPRSGIEKLCEALALIGVLVCVGLFIYYWPRMPETIPTHFDINGKANDWGGKAVFVVFPAMAALMYGLLLVISKFPHTFNYPWPITESNAPVQYRLARALLSWVKACGAWLMVSLAWLTGRTAMSVNEPALPNTFLMLIAAAMIGGIAYYFVKASQSR